ncbi:peptidase, partial [Chitinivorax sp. PXF-14]|uniref:peptidase n=1 Tax=Chitinivorax sp. PXF-14 TaxID=3230488 RepID=UPI0034667133
MNSKPIHIFKVGTHTAMGGATLAFSEADLAAAADAYDPALHEAPIVVGHPRHDNPAYGWIKGLAFAEGGLEASPHQVNPDFAELVASGAFKKVSASFYAPDSPQNPVPGVYYLRHVGFLGAQPPAVKGLRAPEFADAEEGVIEFADWSDMENASLWRRLREWLIGRFGLDEADRTIPSYAVATLEDDARQDDGGQILPATPSYSESTEQPTQESTVTPEQKAALEAENAQLKQQLAEAQARDKAAQAAVRHGENAAFAESLIQTGKLLPAQKGFVVSFMDHIAADAGVIEFGEGEARQSKSGIDGFKAFLQGQPKLVDFQERAGDAGPTVDSNDPLAIHAKAVEFMESEARVGRTVDIAAAVAHVTA